MFEHSIYIVFIHSPSILLMTAFLFVLIGLFFNKEGFRRAAYYNFFVGTVLSWCHTLFVTWGVLNLASVSPQQLPMFQESLYLYHYMSVGISVIFSVICVWLYNRKIEFIISPPSTVFVLLVALGVSLLISSEVLLFQSLTS